MFSFAKKNKIVETDQDDLKSIAESLYKQNSEIAAKNKILSLLDKLYEISILSLEPKDLSKKIIDAIAGDFSFEYVGILKYDLEKDELVNYSISAVFSQTPV